MADRVVYSQAPIASSNRLDYDGIAYAGNFDGNGYVISNLAVNGENFCALFGKTDEGSSITGVGLENTCVAGVRNCVAGLVGWNCGSISDSYSTGDVNSTSSYGCGAGGLVSTNEGSITNCYSIGNVNGNANVGGLVGSNSGSVTSCYSIGEINGDNYVGGLVGNNYHNITSSYSIGEVTGNDCVGGLVGHNYDNLTSSYTNTKVTGGNDYVGGIAGRNSGSITSSFWNIETCGLNVAYINYTGYPDYIYIPVYSTVGIAESKTTAQMQSLSTFIDAGWDFVGETANGTHQIWQMPVGGGYPVQSGFYEYVPIVLSGDGSQENPYLIGDANDLGVVIYYDTDAYYKLIADIDLAGIQWQRAIIPCFGGHFDCNGYIISNMNIDGGGYLGLFGKLYDGAEITNIGLENVIVIGSGDYVAGLAGYSDGNSITNCYSTGDVTGDDYVGGLVGNNYGDSITSCYSTGAVTGSGDHYVGGLVGRNWGSITRSYSSTEVMGSNNEVGGLVGFNSGSVTSSYSTGQITGNNEVGGLVGENYYGDIRNCYSNSTADGNDCVGGLAGSNSGRITRSYSRGQITGNNEVGGLVGENYYGDIRNCFWDIEISDLDIAYVNKSGNYNSYTYTTRYSTEGVAVGKTTEEMKNLSTFTNAGWTLSDDQTGKVSDWYMPYDNFPLLRWQDNSVNIVTIPYIAGLELGQAKNQLQAAGLITGEVSDVNSFTIPAGQVAGISVVQGDKYLHSSLIDIYVSIGSVADGSAQKPYEVASQQDLEHVNDDLSACYIMTADIYMTGEYKASVIASGDSYSDCFSGVFNGNYYAINNLIIDQGLYLQGTKPPLPGYSTPIICVPLGLFRRTVGSDIRNLGIERAWINSVHCNVGCLVGENSGNISNCYCSGTIDGCGDVGGLVGKNGGNISCCYSSASVIGSGSIGGLVGENYFSEADIINSYSKGSVSGSGSMGGLVGSSYHGNVTKCYSSSAVNGSGDYVRGLMGTGGYGGSMSGCYWDFETSGMSTYYYDGLAKTSAEMQTMSTFTDVGWDFVGESINGPNDVWRMCVDGVSYPKFGWEFGRDGDIACGDGIDFYDLAVLMDNWLSDDQDPNFYELADINFDGFINLHDFVVIADSWVGGWPSGPVGMVWVNVDDVGVSGHEGFDGQVSKYEITNGQYCQFLNTALSCGDVYVSGSCVKGVDGVVYYNMAGGGFSYNGADSGGAARIGYVDGRFEVESGFENHPVTYVSWYGAMAFCNYYGYRLPTEWEWQAVADHDGSYDYGCGCEIDTAMANIYNSDHPDGTVAVGSFGNPDGYGYGVCDMAGNVWEWTGSSDSQGDYILRGGSWDNSSSYCTVSFRHCKTAGTVSSDVGFRVCR